MDWIRLCLDPFRSCMGAPVENDSPEEQQQQSATEHTPLLSDSSPSSSDVTRREKGLAVVLLDGEGDMFNLSAIARGYEGGLEMATELQLRTLRHLSQKPTLASKHDVMCYVVYNRQGRMANMAKACGLDKQFKLFIDGFNDSEHFFVDVGSREGAIETRLTTLLTLYLNNPDCDAVFLGGLHLASRASVLRSLDESAKKKVILVHTITIAPVFDQELAFPVTDHLKNLFGDHDASALLIGNEKPKKKRRSPPPPNMIVPASVKLSSLMTTPPNPEHFEVSTEQDALSSQTGCQGLPRGQRIDTSTSLVAATPPAAKIKRSKTASPEVFVPPKLRSSPPVPTIRFTRPHPCNEFYVSPRGCNRPECEYSHSYDWTEEEWAAFPKVIKSKPCRMARSGGICPYGEACFYGHHCPYTYQECKYGDDCHFYQLGLPHADQV